MTRQSDPHAMPDPDYLRQAPDAAAAVAHPGLGYDGYAFGEHEMLPTPAPTAIRDEVHRLRARYRGLASER